MSDGDTLRVFIDALMTLAYVAGPILTAALAAGVSTGIAQTVVQVNEASISFLTKVFAVVGVLVALGAPMAAHMTQFTARCFEAVGHVVK